MLPPLKQVIIGLALLAAGCGDDSCPDGETISVTTGTTDLVSLTYVSAPWDGPLNEFSAGSVVTFVHNLGVAPDLVSTYVSFRPDGTASSEVTENTGNQGEIECIDENVIRIRNNTCSRFYIRVVAARLGDTGLQSQESCE